MLMDASGLGKQSLYNAFGDKKKMYFDAVNCAVTTFGRITQSMNAATSGMLAIEVFFDHLVACSVNESPAISNCIVSNGLLNNAEDTYMQAHHAERWTESHALLRKTIARGIEDGSISKHISPADGADLLMSLASGLRVNARAVKNSDKRIKTNSSKLARARLVKTVALGLSVFKRGVET